MIRDETSEDKGTGVSRASTGLAPGLPATDMGGAARHSTQPCAGQSWAAHVEEDEEINEHSERAARCASIIGEAMGLKGAQLVALRKGALLHDSGKTEIPTSILVKPGPLDDSEWRTMRSHPRHGYASLQKRLPISDILDVVLYHHERYDGNGYPEGLQGEEIPILARIFAVADAYDAMISNRPYRQATTPEAARDEIVRCSGSQFDPVVVEFFCQHFKLLLEGYEEGYLAEPALRPAEKQAQSRARRTPRSDGAPEAVPALPRRRGTSSTV